MKIFKRKKKQPEIETFLGVRKVKAPKVHKHQVLVPFGYFFCTWPGFGVHFLFLWRYDSRGR